MRHFEEVFTSDDRTSSLDEDIGDFIEELRSKYVGMSYQFDKEHGTWTIDYIGRFGKRYYIEVARHNRTFLHELASIVGLQKKLRDLADQRV